MSDVAKWPEVGLARLGLSAHLEVFDLGKLGQETLAR